MSAIKHSTASVTGFPNLAPPKSERAVGPSTSTPIWEPVGNVNVGNVAQEIALPTGEIIDIITQPLDLGETHQAGNDRKERELVEFLRRLTPAQSAALHKRLSNPAAQDPLAIAFSRLIVLRRIRLLAFLADARRRAARLAG